MDIPLEFSLAGRMNSLRDEKYKIGSINLFLYWFLVVQFSVAGAELREVAEQYLTSVAHL